MYHIDNATAAPTFPTPDAVGPNPGGYFRRGNPATGTLATVVDDNWLNSVMMELCNVITSAGIALDKTDNTQLLEAIQTLLQSVPYSATASSPNTYIATLSPVPLSYSDGMLVQIKFTNANTASATINLNSLGAKTIKRPDGSNLSSGDIYDGMVGLITYDGTNFQLINAQTIKASYIQNSSFNYAADSGSANSISASITPAPSSYANGLRVSIKMNATNTGASIINLNGLGSKSIKASDGSALVGNEMKIGQIVELEYDGTNFQLLNSNTENFLTKLSFQKSVPIYANDSGAADAYVVTLTPAPSSYAQGLKVLFKVTNANTGASTLNVNGLGAVAIKKNYNQALVEGDFIANQIVEATHDGTNFQITSKLANKTDAFRATRVAGQSIAASTNVKIGFNTITFDNGSNFDTTNNKYVTAVSGRFLFWVISGLSSTTQPNVVCSIILYKNGSPTGSIMTSIAGGTGTGVTVLLTDTLDLAAGDEIQAYITHNDSTTQSLKASIIGAYKLPPQSY